MKAMPPHPTKKARIEVIPLIDVVFFLLATFVLVSLSMTRLVGLPVDFPEATTARPPEEKQEDDLVTITILSNNNLRWNLDPMNREGVTVSLQKLLRENPNPRVLIAGEEAANFGIAVELLEEARRLGFRSEAVSIKTKVEVFRE